MYAMATVAVSAVEDFAWSSSSHASMPEKSTIAPSVTFLWKDANELTLGGLAFMGEERESPYDRLPLSAKSVVADGVWTKSKECAGVHVDFITNAQEIWVDYTLLESTLAFNGMNADAHSGVDLFAFDTATSMYRWVSTYENITYPNASIGVVAHGLEVFTAQYTEYRLNFPLYNRVGNLKIGVPKVDGAIFEASDVKKANPIVWYGTSIAQGKAAQIPSSSYITQLNLRNYPKVDILNFGFSSNGHMDLEVMRYLNQINDVRAFIIDCLPNMSDDEVANKTIPLVENIRANHNYIMPIILVESATYGYEWFNTTATKYQVEKRATLRRCYDTLVSAGVQGLYYVEGGMIIDGSSEKSWAYQVDGTHPSDLGMYKMYSFWNSYLSDLSLI